MIEERAEARYQEEQAEYEQRMAERAEKEERTGQKIRGRKPKPPEPDPRDKDQVNFTDPESRIMPTSENGWKQPYNAQWAVVMKRDRKRKRLNSGNVSVSNAVFISK